MITLLILGAVALVALSIIALFTIVAYLWICYEQVKERQRL